MKKIVLQDRCPVCRVPIGSPHESGCSIERCSVCGQQAISCPCEGAEAEDHDPMLSIWTGEAPGAAIARFIGLWTRWDERHERWEPCKRSHPDAREDLNAIG